MFFFNRINTRMSKAIEATRITMRFIETAKLGMNLEVEGWGKKS